MAQGAPSGNESRLGTYALAAAGIAGVLACLLIAWPFLGAIVWALALAILFSPVHARIKHRFGHPNLAALLSVAILAIVVVAPAAFVIERLITEAASGAVSLQARVAGGEFQKLLDAYPSIAPLGAWIDRQFDLPSMMASLATWLSNIGATFVRGSFLQVAEVFPHLLPAVLFPARPGGRHRLDEGLAAARSG